MTDCDDPSVTMVLCARPTTGRPPMLGSLRCMVNVRCRALSRQLLSTASFLRRSSELVIEQVPIRHCAAHFSVSLLLK